MYTIVRPGPNELQPCGTSGARRRHIAHGKPCRVCWPDSGLPAMPDSTAGPDWLLELIAVAAELERRQVVRQ